MADIALLHFNFCLGFSLDETFRKVETCCDSSIVAVYYIIFSFCVMKFLLILFQIEMIRKQTQQRMKTVAKTKFCAIIFRVTHL